MKQLEIVVGGQYGSEGKGAIAGYLARELDSEDVAVRVGGPNAGHSVVDQTGRVWPLRQIPVAAVTNPVCGLEIAAGSEIDPKVLNQEMYDLECGGFGVRDRLSVHRSATIITGEHRDTEAARGLVERIGSTGKGIGAARASRIMREAATAELFTGWSQHGNSWAQRALADGHRVLIEGTQGYGLGLHTDWYPKTTSGDCAAVDFCAQAGVSPWSANSVKVWVVVRPNPIRVAGDSGPLLGETSWEALGLPQELTTVTRKVRRVGAWDPGLVELAVLANGGGEFSNSRVRLALTMVDHIDPTMAGATSEEAITPKVADYIDQVEKACGARVELLGTSPSTVVDLR